MNSAFSSLIRFVSGKLISLLVIACILAFGSAAYKEWRELESSDNDRLNAASILRDLDALRHEESSAAIARVAALKGTSLARLESRIAEIEKSLQAGSAGASEDLLSFPLRSDVVTQRAVRKIRSEVLRQELAYLTKIRTYAEAVSNRRHASTKLAKLRADYVDINARYFQNVRLRAQLRGKIAQRIAHPFETRTQLQAFDDEISGLAKKNDEAMDAYRKLRDAIAHTSEVARVQAFVVDEKRIAFITDPLRRHLAEATAAVSGNRLKRLSSPVAAMLPAAAILLLGSFGLHLGFKAFFFYVLAPLAARRKPVRLDTKADGCLAPRDGTAAIGSARSQPVFLERDEQLLILPEYVQTVPTHAVRDTKWLLDWKNPLTCLMSGMRAMERIRTARPDPIVLSSSDNPLIEVAVITIPAGSAMVFQPRGMVGVIHADSAPLEITRRWRLGSLHAWLTLQFRYLIFRGPVTLIVRGTRGVCVERAGDGRAISQAATLGFSANVNYSTTRGGTFFPYYQGKTALLQDSFQADAGYYVYDETPRRSNGSTPVGRGLEGAADAMLKAFGI